jgi:hypothetical protein
MRDNAALMAISKDQKQIALAAKQDSAAMRLISVITIVFLPATFTSVSYIYLNKLCARLRTGRVLCVSKSTGQNF